MSAASTGPDSSGAPGPSRSGGTPGPSRRGEPPAGTTPAGLAAEARSRVGDLLALAAGTVLIDVPAHPNVGDSAIWLGERALLGDLGRRPALECDIDTFDPEGLRPAVAERTVLVHGGGNLGDLWPTHQTLRERVVSVFRDRPVIQLPQSLHFRSEETLERARRVFGEHPDLTLLCRDDRSVDLASRHFGGARVARCPDLALCLPRAVLEAHRAPRPSVDVLWLVRSDHESAWPEGPFPPAAGDWLHEPPTLAGAASSWLAPRVLRRGGTSVWRALHGRALGRAAADRVARGIRLLSSARVVVTDRLHTHILCALLGIPHVVLADAFGKLEAHCATWPGLARLASRAAGPDEAAERATALLEGME